MFIERGRKIKSQKDDVVERQHLSYKAFLAQTPDRPHRASMLVAEAAMVIVVSGFCANSNWQQC